MAWGREFLFIWHKGIYRTSNQPWKLLYPEQQYRLKIKKGREGFSDIYRCRICNLLLRKLECLVLRLDKPATGSFPVMCPLVPSLKTDSQADGRSWWWIWLVPFISPPLLYFPFQPLFCVLLAGSKVTVSRPTSLPWGKREFSCAPSLAWSIPNLATEQGVWRVTQGSPLYLFLPDCSMSKEAWAVSWGGLSRTVRRVVQWEGEEGNKGFR
jgi:hypothetical protein